MRQHLESIALATVVVWSCGCMSAGTHGSIKNYTYAVSKYKLEKTVHAVIKGNSHILQDSLKGYYNDDTGYITITISQKEGNYKYTFRFYGRKEYWDTSKTSCVFIAYASDNLSDGGSEGNGGVEWYNLGLKKKLTILFEREFILKVDSMLGIKHIEE